ncbi:MAG: PEGA domain-containing protein, partial [Lentisphaeria bacterium]|nr:PEGA domain-containing protein [Lentisphaeria bacterium]
SNLGTLIISSVPSNAEVIMDGKSIGRTPFRDQVEEGKHEIELRRNGYVSLKKSVQVRSKGITKLEEQVLEVKSGSIQIKSAPSGAKILINGKNYGDTPFNISNLKPGTYSVRLEKAGYDPAVRKVNLPAGENLDLMFNLDSNTGGVDIVTQPPGITVYLDGRQVGITEKDADHKNISKVLKIRNLSMGEHHITLAHKRARPEKKNISFSVQKGKVARLTNLNMWIPNAVLVRTNGARETGRIIQDLPSKYEFEPSPGVKFTVEKSSVKKVEYLPESE